MSGIRQSFVFAKETSFGKGNDGSETNNPWINPPPGSFITTTHNRHVDTIRTAGHKKWDVPAYGAVGGSFTWSFVLDYRYLEPMYLAFEYYTTSDISNQTKHIFKKVDNRRVPSFVIRRAYLTKMAGGTQDMIQYLYGCVVRNIRFSKASLASQINVEITGLYSWEDLYEPTMPNEDVFNYTDYEEYIDKGDNGGGLSEWLCMKIGDTKMGDVQSIDFSIGNNANAVYTTCSPKTQNYYEMQSEYQLGWTVYAIHDDYKRMLYGGGQKAATSSPVSPMIRNLAPLSKVELVTDDSSTDPYTGDNDSTESISFEMTKIVVNSLTWQRGDGSQLVDALNSCDTQSITMTVTLPKGMGTFQMNANSPNKCQTEIVKGKLHDDATNKPLYDAAFIAPNMLMEHVVPSEDKTFLE